MSDLDNPNLNRLVNDDVKLIGTADYADWYEFVDEVCSCDAILSSSLHGLIVAEAYGIRNIWVEFSDEVIGAGFKYRDFFASIGVERGNPVRIDEAFDLEMIDDCEWEPGQINLEALLDACPFQIEAKREFKHPMVDKSYS